MQALERSQARRSLRMLMEVHLFVAAWFWGVAVVAAVVILVLLDRYRTVDGSVLDLAAQVGMWFNFGIATYVTTQHLPVHVAAGVTRRAFVVASIIGALLTAGVYAVVQTVLLQVERAAFGAAGWAHVFTGAGLFTSTDQVLAVLAQHLVVFAAGGLPGLLVGVVYYRFGAGTGTLALLVTATPVLVASGMVRTRGDWLVVTPPDAVGVRAALAVLVLVVVVVAYRLVARRVPIATTTG